MKRIRIFAFAVFLASTHGPLEAQEHLVPIDEHEALGRYHAMLRQVFSAIRASEMQGSAIIIPSFSPETAVAIRRRNSRYSVVTLRPEIHLWRYELIAMNEAGNYQYIGSDAERNQERDLRDLRRDLPKNPGDVRLARCERPLSNVAANRVLARWESALSEVRPIEKDDSSEIILDGTSFEFWMRDPSGDKTGSTYSPSGGQAGAAAAIANELIRFCAGNLSERKVAIDD